MGSISAHPRLPVITGTYVPVHKPKPKIDDEKFNGQQIVDMVWYDEAGEISPEALDEISSIIIRAQPPEVNLLSFKGPKLTLWQRLKKTVDRLRTTH